MLLRAVLLLALCPAASAFTVPHRAVSPCRARAPLLGLRAASDDSAPPNPVAADAPAYAASLAVQGMPLALDDRLSHYVFFLTLATLTVYLGARAPSIAPPEAPDLSVRQALLAPVFSSASLGALYYCITVLELDPSLVYRAFTSLAAAGAAALLVSDALLAAFGVADADAAGTARVARASAALAAAAVGAYLYLSAGGLGLDAASGPVVASANFLAWALALATIRAVPLRSFGVGALLLGGLFCYDVYFVFFSDVMLTVATRVDAPVKFVASNPPGSATRQAILGLGDVALPGLLVGVLARYGAAAGGAAGASPPAATKWSVAAVAGYALGLVATFYANENIRRGEPALLFLVPAVVGAGVATALLDGGRPGLAALLEYREAPTEAPSDGGA